MHNILNTRFFFRSLSTSMFEIAENYFERKPMNHFSVDILIFQNKSGYQLRISNRNQLYVHCADTEMGL